MRPPRLSPLLAKSALFLVVTTAPLAAQPVVVLPDSATATAGATTWPFSNTILGDFSNGGLITSGTTTLAEALTFGALPVGGADSHTPGRFAGTPPAGSAVTYNFALPRELSGVLLWNYNEIYEGVLYNERGVTRADITVTHSGGTTVFDNVPFVQTAETGGAAQLATAQQFNFGSPLTGVTRIVLSDLQGSTSFLGWTDFAAVQPSAAPPLVQKYWDGTSFDGDANGGSGVWDTVTANWDTAETAGTDQTWTQGGNASFKGSFNGLVTLGEPITANILTFDLAGYVISGSTLTLAGAQPSVIANRNATITSALGGSASIIKTGLGQLTLAGSSTAFTGTLTSLLGNLAVTSPNWDGATFSPVGGSVIFDSASPISIKSLALGNAAQINNGTRLNIAGGTLTQTGTGGSVSTGAGAAGSLTSSSGNLTIYSSVAAGQTIGVPLADFNAATPLALKLDGPGGSLVSDIELTAANTYSGGTTLDNGRLRASNPAAFGTGPVSINQDGQAYLVTATSPFLNNFILSGTGWTEGAGSLGAIRLSGATVAGSVTIEPAGARIVSYVGETGTFTGSLLGSGNLEVNLPGNTNALGTINLNGDGSSYTGAITVGSGRLNLGGANGTSAVTVSDLARLGGEGSVAGTLTLGATGGATLAFNTTTPGTLTTGPVTLNGVTHLAPEGAITGGTPVPFLTYSGTLTDGNGGTLSDSFDVVGGYRSPVVTDNAGTLALTVATESIIWTGVTDGIWTAGGPADNWTSSDTFFFNGDAVLFDDTAITASVALTATVQPASVTFNNSTAVAYTVSGGTIGGNGNITKNNDGSVFLASPLGTTGNLVVNGGMVNLAGTARNIAGITVKTGASFETAGTNLFVPNHTTAIPGSRTIAVDGGLWTITATHDARFGNVALSNGGSIVSNRPVTAWDALMADTDAGAATLSVSGTGPSFMDGPGGIHLQGIQNFVINDTTGDAEPDLSVSLILDGPGMAAGAAGGINKTGAGTLSLNGINTYTGATTIAAGTLGGIGSVTSPVAISTGATLAPGTGVGTFTVNGSVTIAGTLAIEVDDAASDQLVVNGALNLTGSTLAITALSTPSASAYVLATASSITGAPVITGVPAGYQVKVKATEIVLEPAGTGTPYENWIDTFATLTDPADKLPAADADKDGTSNLLEFALAGNPTDPADRGKVFPLKGDGADPGTAPQLILTLAVRKGAVFSTGAAPSATLDGVIYTIEGSQTLGTFTAPVSALPAALPPANPPALGADWEWRSFSLDGSGNFPGKGFLRARIESAP